MCLINFSLVRLLLGVWEMKVVVYFFFGDGFNLEYMWMVVKFGMLCGVEISNGFVMKEGM